MMRLTGRSSGDYRWQNLAEGLTGGEWPYRHDPRDRLQLSYAFQPPDPDRIARAYPPRDWCAWSPEIARKRTREMERDQIGVSQDGG